MKMTEREQTIEGEKVDQLMAELLWTVTPDDVDDMGVVYYGAYSHLFDQTRYALCRAFGYPGTPEARAEGWLLPVLQYSLKILRSARAGDELTIRGWWHWMKGVRIRFAAEIRDNRTDEVIGYGYTEHCFVDRDTFKPVKPDPNWTICLRYRNGSEGPLGIPASRMVRKLNGEWVPVAFGKIPTERESDEGGEKPVTSPGDRT